MSQFNPSVDPSMVPEPEFLPGLAEGEIVVIRSPRRKRSVSASRQGGRIVVSIPSRMSKAQERAMVPEMIAKVRALEAEATHSESVLRDWVVRLLELHTPEITQRPTSVSWKAMRERWGSCTSVDGTIRISDRLQGAPDYVLEYVLLHEAIHLHQSDHGPEFQALLARFPDGERAEAYLAGYDAAEQALTLPPALRNLGLTNPPH